MNVGISEPPVTALLAASAPAIPSILPCPNNSFFFENLFASLYPKKAAILAPAPGNIPIMLPITVDLKDVGNISKICFLDNKTLLSNSTIFPACLIFFSASIKTCDIEKSPISAAVNGIPESNAGTPNVKRGFPSIGSIPTVESIKPNAPEIKPFTIDFVLAPAIIVKPNIDNQKYSAGPKSNASFASLGANK